MFLYLLCREASRCALEVKKEYGRFLLNEKEEEEEEEDALGPLDDDDGDDGDSDGDDDGGEGAELRSVFCTGSYRHNNLISITEEIQ